MTAPADGRYDVVIVSDLRFPGGTGASIAEEIKAQAAAGYSTALVHVAGPVVSAHRGFHPGIARALRDGLAELVDHDAAVSARLLVLRHPGVFRDVPAGVPAISADRKVLVVNQAPRDDTMVAPHYDVGRVEQAITTAFGEGFVWAPIGPLVRDSLIAERPDLPVAPDDWVNVVDVDEWRAERSSLARRRPVLGRHSRPDARKWPARRADILAAYPDDPAIDVRILGSVPRLGLKWWPFGRVPANWRVEPFGSADPREFVAGLDFFVYFHHPGLVEAFGRAPLEAIASGAVAILPTHFERVFGDAAVYTSPRGVRDVIERMTNDAEAHAAQVETGLQRTRERFGHDAHVARIRTHIGDPSAAPHVASRWRRPIARRVLFVSSNGGGMGHLTRLLAMARRSSPGVEPVFLTLSTAVPVVRELGFLCEYFASWEHRKISGGEWDPHFSRRLDSVIATYRPRAVVFDGTAPYAGLLENAERHTEVPFVWSRRAMWKPGAGKRFRMAQADSFRLVIEPGEVAHELDAGLTAQHRDQALPVDPVLLLRPEEPLEREAAREELRLDPSALTALVTLGAGNIADVSEIRNEVVGALTKVEGLQVCVTDPMIAEESPDRRETGIRVLSVHPLSRYLSAFDFAVAASGYNSFHELVAAGTPTIYVPNRATALDDQEARARFAREAGAGWCVLGSGGELRDALSDVLDAARRAEVRSRAAALVTGDGAAQAMRAVEELT